MAWDRNQMAERAGRELQDGWYVNLGIGIPENTLLEVKKLKNPQDTSINNIKESKFADLYTESCQYE